MRHLFLLAIFALAMLTGGGERARAANDAAFASLARSIVAGLDNAPMASLPAHSGYGAPRVAVRTVGRGADTAERNKDYTRRFLRALQSQANGRFSFVALDALDGLIRDIKARDLPPAEQRNRIRDLRANAQADILVAGVARIEAGTTRLSYQAINTSTGELLASTAAELVYREAPPRPTIVASPVMPKPGPFRRTVREAERLLFEKGYDPGPVDGHMTRETRDALRAYQLDSALPVNGRLTRRTVENLRRDSRSVSF